MPGLFREVSIRWKGEDLRFVPTMALLRRMESDGVSLSKVALQTVSGDPPVSFLSPMIAHMIREAGGTATEEDVFEELMTGKTDDIIALIETFLKVCNPTEDDPKKPEASVAVSKPKRKPTK